MYRLSEAQAQAILDMRLNRLTGLEQDKILEEYSELLALIADLSDILARPERLTEVVRDELMEIREQYGDARRTEISLDHLNLSTEDLIEPQDVVVTLSHAGYAKSQPVSDYQAQRRGGRGKAPPRPRTRISSRSCSSRTRTTRCCASRITARCTGCGCSSCRRPGAASRGKPMVNLLPLAEGEKITAVLPIKQFDDHALRVHGDAATAR